MQPTEHPSAQIGPITRQQICPVCGDIVLTTTGRCISNHVWPPLGSMRTQTRQNWRDIDVPRRPPSWEGRISHFHTHTMVGGEDAADAWECASLSNEALWQAEASLSLILAGIQGQLALRQATAAEPRRDGSDSFLRVLQRARGPRGASTSSEIEYMAAQKCSVNAHDANGFVKSLGLRKVRRMRLGRNTYFYQYRFPGSARFEFVKITDYPPSG